MSSLTQFANMTRHVHLRLYLFRECVSVYAAHMFSLYSAAVV